MAELKETYTEVKALTSGNIKIDLSIARGLDYYTGIVFETLLDSVPQLGSVCSGGRYDNLVSRFSNTPCPGIGGSIGVDRLASHLQSSSPARDTVGVAVATPAARHYAFIVAGQLRAKGMRVVLDVSAKNFKKPVEACPSQLTIRWSSSSVTTKCKPTLLLYGICRQAQNKKTLRWIDYVIFSVQEQMDTKQFDNAEQGEDCSPEAGLFGFDVPYTDCALVILGVPWELTVSYGQGTAQAPQAILQASHQIDLCTSPPTAPYRRGIHYRVLKHEVASPSPTPADRVTHIKHVNALSTAFNSAVYNETRSIISDGKLLGLVGGEHAIAFGYLQFLHEFYPAFGILHLDAHLDYRCAYQGYIYSHASIMYQVMTELDSVQKMVHVGIRDFCLAEKKFAEELDKRDKIFFACELHRRGFAEVVTEIVSHLPSEVYISFDIDALDPSLCPSTGTPVPGGLSFYDVELLLQMLVASGKKIIGFDLSEVVPGYNHWDENVASRILYRLCAAILRSVPPVG